MAELRLVNIRVPTEYRLAVQECVRQWFSALPRDSAALNVYDQPSQSELPDGYLRFGGVPDAVLATLRFHKIPFEIVE